MGERVRLRWDMRPTLRAVGKFKQDMQKARDAVKALAIEYGPWYKAYKCRCGRQYNRRYFERGLIPPAAYPPSVCLDCGRPAPFNVGASRTVSQVTYSRFLKRKQLRLIKHEWKVS